MKAVIHVNRHLIAANAKDGGSRPVFTVKAGGRTYYAHNVDIQGPSKMVSPGTQLSCGARAWLEANFEDLVFRDSDGNAHDGMSFSEAKEMLAA